MPYSEIDPGKLRIEIESCSEGQIELLLEGFREDIVSGNIYNTEIQVLAKNIKEIITKHIH